MISILPVSTKLAEKFLLDQLEHSGIYGKISRAQTGFIPGLGTQVNLCKFIRQTKSLQRSSNCNGVLFVNFATAFDNVIHERLFWKLERQFEIDEGIIAVIKNIYRSAWLAPLLTKRQDEL